MSIVAACIYGEGCRLHKTEVADLSDIKLKRGEFAWIGLLQPDEAELRHLQERFDLHPLAVEDALMAHQMPKLDVYGDQLFIVARTANLVDDKIAYGETDIFVGANHIITVRHGSARAHTELRQRLEAAPVLLKHGVDYVLHGVLDFIVDGYLPLVEFVEDRVEEMERNAIDNFLDREAAARIFNLRRDLSRFRRLVGPMEEVMARLEHHALPCIDPEIRPYFRDVRDHLRRVSSMVDGLRDALTSTFELSSLLEQQRQSDITRKLAAWAAILAVPTAIAGIYGMNFEVMPELHWKYGYFAVLSVVIVLCFWLYWRFRKAKWL